MGTAKKKLALVYGNLPTVEEIDQFLLLAGEYDVTVITSESICGYLTQTSYFQDLRCVALPDHNDNPTYLPGLEKILKGFDTVVVKERLGMYAYQAIKAKWRNRFRLVFWCDNATPFPGEDIKTMRTVRVEANNAADAFIVQSEVVRNALIIEGVEPARIMNFKPYVEPRTQKNGKSRAKACQALGLADTNFVIAHFGQIEWEEALFDLAHALKLLEAMDKSLAARTRLVFCGIGSFSTELRDRLVQLGLDRQVIYVAPSRQAFETLLTAADCQYFANNPARDRLEGEPYRIVTAMANQVPLLAARHPLIEEYCGKHRLDFCQGSPASIAATIKKAASAKALRNNVVAKNVAAVKKTKAKVASEMTAVFAQLNGKAPTIDANAIDHQVLEAESLVFSKQYLAAIDLIESIFNHAKTHNIPTHHHANLTRLIGDSFIKLGDGDAAKNAYNQAIELDPYAAKAYIGLGTVALTRQIYDISVLNFQKAVSLAPDDEMANLGLGLAFQGLGEHNEASRWVVKALEINPENTAALYTLVQTANDRNKFTEAEAALSAYVSMHPADHNMTYTLAAIKHRIGNNVDAKTLCETLLAIDPYDDKAAALLKQIARTNRAETGESNG
jgi:tetratricopeptide (TPR) repeat protein